MAQSGYTPILIYASGTATNVPLAANMTSSASGAELGLNYADGKLYYKDNGGNVQVIATKGAGTIGGSNTQIQYNNNGTLAGNAAMTFNSGTNVTTLTTLNLSNALGATYGGTAQSAYAQGDVLYASATNTLSKLGIGTVNYILTSTGSVPQWSAPSSITVQTATNLAGGAAGSVPYQSAADTTTFLSIGAANRVMTSSGSAPQWVTALTGLTGVSSSSITNTSLTSGRVVYSGTGGLETDSANLTFDGTTLSATGFSTTGLSTLVKTVTVGNSNFSGVAVFAPSTPAKLYVGTGTVTDATSAIGATNATGAISSLAITPIAATNTSVTYTDAATLYIAGAPSAGTNITLTNPYALYIAAGNVYLGGGTASGVAYLNANKVLTTGSALTFDGTTFQHTGASNFATSTGNVGIGTSSPAQKLDVNGQATILQGAAYGWRITNSGGIRSGSNGVLQVSADTGNAYANSAISFDIDGNTYATLDASGNLGLGVTPTTTWNSAFKVTEIKGAGNAFFAGGSGWTLMSSNAFYGASGWQYGASGNLATAYEQYNGTHVFKIAPNNGGAAGATCSFTQAMTLDASSRLLVGLTSSLNGNGAVQAGGFSDTRVVIDGSSTQGIFFTKSGADNGTYRVDASGNYNWFVKGAGTANMTLDASGNLLVGTTSAVARIGAYGSNADIQRIYSTQASSASYTFISMFSDGATPSAPTGTLRVNIVTNGGIQNYSANNVNLSDRREKTNFAPAKSYLDVICAIPVQTFNYIDQNMEDDPGLTLGVVAQDVQAVAPELVSEGNWASKDEEPKMRLSIYQTDLQYALMKCIQEQQALITQLTARITALEGA